jgi:multiple antibiotic resistance protein
MNWIDFALVFQIFILLNPLASVPFLLGAHKKKFNIRKIAINSVITAFIVALVITLFGDLLFNLFGISLDSLRIAGGVILLLLGINMINPKHREDEITTLDSLIALIATPMLTGPGTISFITIKAAELGKAVVLTNVLVAFIFVGVVFILMSVFINKINLKIVDITSRVMGLFLTAVAIEMMAKGIEGIIMVWK